MTDQGWPGSWCEIYCDRITRNLRLALKHMGPGRQFCAVLKADAYGHGIAHVVPLVMAEGVDCIGITSNEEAQAVRSAGFTGSLIRLRPAPQGEMAAALAFDVEEQVSSVDTARALAGFAAQGHAVKAHLSLNAGGMSRDGLELSAPDGPATCQQILDLVAPQIVGICSHFPSNSPQDLAASNARFQRDVAWVFANSTLIRSDVVVHAGSSLTLVSGSPVDTDMLRCGAILYGILKPEWGFVPTMALKARVISLRHYPKGSTVGYDRAHLLESERQLACVSIGYANGIRRASEGLGAVEIAGHRAPVLGKISMNTLVADVSRVADVQVGQTVTLFGDSLHTPPPILQAEAQFQSIMADLFTDWGLRNPRVLHAALPRTSA